MILFYQIIQYGYEYYIFNIPVTRVTAVVKPISGIIIIGSSASWKISMMRRRSGTTGADTGRNTGTRSRTRS